MEPNRAGLRFRELAASDSLPLDLGAALIAAEDQEGVDPEAILADLDRIAARVRIPSGCSVYEGIARLNVLLFEEMGLRGDQDSYDDPQNSWLDRVVERRLGLPITLSVLMIEVGRRAGVAIDGIGFPGHFLVSPRDPDATFYVDPFRGGDILKPEVLEERLERLVGGALRPEHRPLLGPVTPRQILLRMCLNLKGSAMRRQDMEGAFRATDRMLALAPGLHEHRRDRGLMLIELGHLDRALVDLAAYLDTDLDESERSYISALVHELEDALD